MPHSQHGEEAVILEYFRGRAPGRFLDIGAADGKTFSNTYGLYEAGWKGTVVEPSSNWFTALMNLYGTDPEMVLVNAVVAAEPAPDRLIPFHLSPDLVSTTSEAHRRIWSTVAPFRTVHVPSISVARVVELAKEIAPIDMVSIDTEATSWEILRAAWPGLRDAGATLIAVEADGFRTEIAEFAAGIGYTLLGDTGENVIYGIVAKPAPTRGPRK